MKLIELFISKTRYFSLFIIFVALLGAVLIPLASLPVLLDVILESWNAETLDLKTLKLSAVKVLTIIDVLLIATGLQMIATGIYTIFINPQYSPQDSMIINNFGKLKLHIIKLAGIVLIISFLEKAISIGPSQYLLGYGAAISLIILSGALAHYLEFKSKDNESK